MNIEEIKNRIIFESFMDLLIVVTESNAKRENFEYLARLKELIGKSFVSMPVEEKEKIKSRLIANTKSRIIENEAALRIQYSDQGYEEIAKDLMKTLNLD